jgi:serine/threonine protein kinase
MSEVHRFLAHGRYRLQAVLGEGGMAVVYRAFDSRLQVDRAIKVLSPAVARQEHLRARFETEARTMAALSHPNITSVHDIGQDGELIYMVMELLEGGSLWDWVQCYGPMPPLLALQAVRPIIPAVTAAHLAGVVHRDIKPHNIMLTADGEPRLTDFGIAHVQDPLASRNLTRTGSVIGTWGYMAPEQRHSAKTVDGRSDVYALGATLYAIATGEVPVDLFASDEADEVLVGLPQPLADLIRGATSYRPDDRYQDPATMGLAMDQALESLPPVPPGTPALGVLPADVEQRSRLISGFSAPWSRSELGMAPARDLRHGNETRSDTFDIPELSREEARGRWASQDPEAASGRQDSQAPVAAPAVLPLDHSEVEPPTDSLIPRTRTRLWVELFGVLVILGLGAWLVPRIIGNREDVQPDPLPPDVVGPIEPPPPIDPHPEPPIVDESLEPDIIAPTGDQGASSKSPTSRPVTEATSVVVPVIAPEPEPGRTAPAQPEPPPPPPEPAIVSVDGDVREVYLVDGKGQRHGLGSVPAGTYTVMASFEAGQEPFEAGEKVVLEPGEQVQLRCNPDFVKCQR